MKVIFKKSGFLDFASKETISALNEYLQESGLHGDKLDNLAQKTIKKNNFLSHRASKHNVVVLEIL
jgi:hypothetical protein